MMTPAAAAHVYWIAPEDFTVRPGDRVEARLMVGEMLRGTELPWLSHQIRSFRVAGPGGVRGLGGMEGDLPAVAFTASEPGLHVIAHETEPLTVTFETFEEFREYLEFEGLGAVADAHRRRGLGETDITEAYRRAAKALVQVGPVRPGETGRALGLDHELVALANPYAGGEMLPVRLLWRGEPVADAPVAVLWQDDGVERRIVFTDAEGRVEIALRAGARHVLNAVHIEPVEGEDHVWESTWASLSFAVPSGE